MASARHLAAYRSVLREVRLNASISPRPQRTNAISTQLRLLFEKPRSSEDEKRAFGLDIENAVTFLRAQRKHKVLIDRYNPLVDLTAEERIHATARRVGFDMPVTHKAGSEDA
ncbi:hypothetical protein PLICRDRAFT_33614 [Plicaturopsis crispa FD-325 SS-3]|nr:hypothetical protein PLICRDRAFT_33614 [Plicaturopsis crispa FD-325 SS-3]